MYIEGRQYPVDNYFTVESQSDYLDSALVTCLQTHVNSPQGDGHILVFLTGFLSFFF